MKKSTLYTGLGFVTAGAACWIFAIFFEWRIDGLLWGFGGSLLGPGTMMLWKYFHWTKPQNREIYEKMLQQEKVEIADERNVMLRDKSGRITFQITMLLYCALMLFFSFCSVMGWFMPFAKYAIFGLFALLVFEYLCLTVVFGRLSKKL